MKSFYVTTPIYYVNDVPHIGHSYTTIAADVLGRFWRACGRDVRFLTGTDEHGIKIVKAAAEKQTTPRELADSVHVQFKELWRQLDISNDDFIRTTEPRHEKRVQRIVADMAARDEVYKGKYEGWYDEGQEEYVTESAAREQEFKSAINGRPLVRYSEENWFFRLAKWVPALIKHTEADPRFIQPDARRNEVLSKLKLGVEDLCISRNVAKLPWGIAMPNDPQHVIYVWVDALSNYLTACGLPEIGDEFDRRAEKYWPADVHLIGKDILWFHAVYWPCILLALGRPLPRCVYAHGWWTSEGKKMSKTLGNFISREVIAEICDQYSPDAFRYFLLRAMTFGQDGDFSRDMFKQRYNVELANGVGNLLSRTTNMVDKYFDGLLPAPGEAEPRDDHVRKVAADLAGSVVGLMEALEFHAYLEKIAALTAATNKYIDDTAPFKLAKDPAQKPRLATVLYNCAEALRLILIHLCPVMPSAGRAGLEQLGWPWPQGKTLIELGNWGLLPAGAKTTKGQALFPRKE
ncbi:MAG: methionine--tRNA ligase [Planctomycetes bacterium]|nr:methionine--tRNA ligase [Planctomycetota bacterium]